MGWVRSFLFWVVRRSGRWKRFRVRSLFLFFEDGMDRFFFFFKDRSLLESEFAFGGGKVRRKV